ncbi:helix-turn-helix transcriptional regulator [Paramixta manurensis]|uniref:Helix-turn-helix transcriptional regulator n=1 Tax=Paramixta manurensis TaxID=2740817 RepID=A0A6M8UF38_9GAMM|nr:helix-turn-helix transcriptional regulator [Erwiniaceae bacterium PD-1]
MRYSTGTVSGPDQSASPSLTIGSKIKHLRQLRGLSLSHLSKLSGVSKAALSKLESGSSNPRVDTLDAIAVALRLPLGDLIGGNSRLYPYFERGAPMQGDYSQKMKFRIGIGNISEIWHLQMNPGVVINSLGHSIGTHEHIMVHSGTLLLALGADEKVQLQPGDFYGFSGVVSHSYISKESAVSATVVMSHMNQA